MQENIEKPKFKMKHLIKVLTLLEVNSVIDLFKYIENCFEYELQPFAEQNEATQAELLKQKTYTDTDMVNILVKYHQVNYYQFVVACLMATKSIDREAAEDIIDGGDLIKLGNEFQSQIVAMQTIVSEPANPNETATN